MELSVNKKVWKYILIILSLMIISISFLFYIKPIFIAVVLGIFITVFIDKSIEMFKEYTNHWVPSKRKAAAASCVIAIVFLGSVFMISAAINIKNNFEDLLEIYNDFRDQYNEITEDLAEDLADIANDSLNAVNSTSSSILGNQTENNTSSSSAFNNTSNGLFLKTTRSDIIKMTVTSNSRLIASTKDILSLIKIVDVMSERISIASTKDILSLITSTIFAAILVIPLTALYYFKEKRTLKQKIVSFAPDKYKDIFEKTIQDVFNDIKTYTITKILEVFVISFLYCISFYVIGLPHWFIIGLLMGVSNFVPYVGFVIPAVPAIVYAYSVGMDSMFAAAAVIIVIQLFNYFIILPNVVMKTIRISPLTAVLLTLAGLKLFGFFGLIFALPIYIFCKIVLIACYKLLVVMYPDSNNDIKEITDEA